jgi:membrane protein YdbS with pleckstrin-like domain
MRRVRVLITFFVVLLIALVGLGWMWTGSHQPPALRHASHVVLALAACAGIFGLARIWRPSRS